MPRCVECKFFAGRSRDKHAVLFRQKKGYCDNVDHAWGIWNVVQDITKGHCDLFEDASETVKEQRKFALSKIGIRYGS